MFKNFALTVLIAVTLVGCQMKETMVLNEDGSGKISISMDMREMMAFGSEMEEDSLKINVDTIIRMKDFLVEKKDSIAKLDKEEQERLKKLENYKFRTLVNYETQEMLVDVYTDFKNVNEANDIMSAFSQSGSFMQGMSNEVKIEDDPDSGNLIGVDYSFRKGKFMRDAFIIDKEKHSVQMDSIAQAEAFMSSMKYTLKYTFPKKIKSSSIEDAKFSLDGKTIEVERSFIDYMKDPNVLDLTIELEN
ncbi:MAG: hypothetical protein HKN48_07035 [Flavobacteriaceae bacterium]|nr:hypothetical protein [Flavobacteriaceae bacterium]